MPDQKTILCVDDETEIIELLSDEFDDRGYKTLKASSGNQGFKLYEENKVSCIISDIRMPDGNGIQFLKKIREINKTIPFFFITGYSDHSEKEIAQLGVTAVVFKPFDIDELVDMVIEKID